MQSWLDDQADITRLAHLQLFFIGGAPRSGTTWLQQMLNFHPDISCRGEGLFSKHLAEPLEAMMSKRRQALEEKNQKLFAHTGGYPLPSRDDVECLLGTAILLAMRRQCSGRSCSTIGEKTPENIFLFPRLKRLFPGAKLIGMARDPRDVVTSAWHMFAKVAAGADDITAKKDFIRKALPSLNEGARRMVALEAQFPADYLLVTYEKLHGSGATLLANIFRFLGVSDDQDLVRSCLDQTRFEVLTEGRPAGVERTENFLRKGVIGGWTSTLTPELNSMILEELGWMFPRFGWQA